MTPAPSTSELPQGLPLQLGSTGDAVRDLQQRLVRCGEPVHPDQPGLFGGATARAVRAFQERRGLNRDGVCGSQTWAALVEAGYQLGDRLLYHRSPMLRGDDVADLQVQLNALGFHAGRPDGIFGPNTAEALTDFQANTGLTSDGVCGPEVLTALRRLGDRTHGMSKAGVRERVELLGRPRELTRRRVVIGEIGTLPALASAMARAIEDVGARVMVVHHPDGSVQAAEANRFGADVVIGLTMTEEPGCRVAYYGRPSYESAGGRQLATRAREHLMRIGAPDPVELLGMTLPLLRETRMPALSCELGPPSWVVEHTAEIGAAVAAAVVRWSAQPLDDDALT